jgi:PKD repeat protein
MRNFVLILVLFAVFHVTGAGMPPGGDEPTDCHAAFSANPDAGNPMLFHFLDQSLGQINHWQWSFGDGVTSTQQSPDHVYPAGGTYFVCLTVSDSDSGFLCHDVMCMPVTVHEPGTCVADFIYAIDSVNTLKTIFTDKSTGNIDSWHWDFGDGSVSAERNPQHVFPSFGKYRVCLSAYKSDSVSVCNDVKCDSVLLVPALACHASFVSELDSLNREPNTFKFTNHSTGDPNRFSWSFDDGVTYTSRNVVHRFQAEGAHEVCLLVRKEIQGVSVCKDSLCETISTARYFNLGGHLFTGDYPINNPVPTGDTGRAYLYRKDGSRLIPYDTVRFTNLGYYAFPNILNGSYVVRAELTPGSAHYPGFFPVYFPQALKWQEAAQAELTDSSSYVSHIYMVPLDEPAPGPGMIRGKVAMAGSAGNSGELAHAEVILYNSEMSPLLFSESDQSGRFEIGNLPYGAYSLYVEYPGSYSRMTPVWLDSNTPVADSILLEVYGYDVTGIHDMQSQSGIQATLFPNPAAGELHLSVRLPMAAELDCEIRSMAGPVLWSGRMACSKGSDIMTIPVRALPAGIYLFSVHAGNGLPGVVKKLVKY